MNWFYFLVAAFLYKIGQGIGIIVKLIPIFVLAALFYWIYEGFLK